MTITITAKQYLDDLEKRETKKPRKRRRIPSKQAMAKAGGVRRQAIYEFLDRESHQRLDLRIIDGIITACRNHGHDTKLTDLLRYEK